MIISLANSLRFVTNDGLMPSFANTLFANETFRGVKNGFYCQKFIGGETLIVQAKAGTSDTITLNKYASGVVTAISSTETSYTDFKITDFEVPLVSGDSFYLIASDGTNTWTSEPVEVEETLSGYLKCEWFNNDPMVANANFEYDYSTALAVANANCLYVKGRIFPYTPAGKADIFDNQNEKIKLKQNLFRQLTMETEPIPRYLSEKIQIAMAHDVFSVNDVIYTVEDLAKMPVFGKTNFVTLKAELTEKDVLGLNSHDTGFDCDAITTPMADNKVKENATTSGSFSVSAGYGVTQIITALNSGSNVKLKVGTTIGGEEILYETPVSSATPAIYNVRYTPSVSAAWTIYYTLSGTSPDIYLSIQTIKFTQ